MIAAIFGSALSGRRTMDSLPATSCSARLSCPWVSTLGDHCTLGDHATGVCAGVVRTVMPWMPADSCPARLPCPWVSKVDDQCPSLLSSSI
jgi:hypothetical protein